VGGISRGRRRGGRGCHLRRRRDPADLARHESDAPWVDRWWGGDGSATAYDFHGLTVIQSPIGVFTDGTDCLSVVPTSAVSEDGTSVEGQMYYGCAAGVFPAVAQFTISETSPDEL